jgi:2-iminobutanoate/2-iminopropanoate deaminase
MVTIIDSDNAPAAIGAYSHATVHCGCVFTSGQIALNRAGEMIGDDAASETDQVMGNLEAVLNAAGSSLARALKINIYLVDMNDFAVVNERYAEAMAGHRPARACVQVARLPRDARVEIDCVAAAGEPCC